MSLAVGLYTVALGTDSDHSMHAWGRLRLQKIRVPGHLCSAEMAPTCFEGDVGHVHDGRCPFPKSDGVHPPCQARMAAGSDVARVDGIQNDVQMNVLELKHALRWNILCSLEPFV